MSELSYLEKLLDGVEVEWKAVGDIAGYSTTKVDADKLDATSFVGVDNLLADKGGRIDATYQPNTARLTAYEPGDILLGNIRPYLKKVWMAENNGGCSGDVLAIRILADCKKLLVQNIFTMHYRRIHFFLQYAARKRGKDASRQ